MKTWKERRDEAAKYFARTHTLKPGHTYSFKQGCDFGYQEALKDMEPVIEALKMAVPYVAISTPAPYYASKNVCTNSLKIQEALALFEKLKAETKE
jgi:hypothetical protein